jgi:hypothetical protein
VIAFNWPYKLGLMLAALVGIVVGMALENRSLRSIASLVDQLPIDPSS